MKVKCPKAVKMIFWPIARLKNIVKEKIKRSIRLELLTVFVVCLLASMMMGAVAAAYFGDRREARLDYSGGMLQIDEQAKNVADQVKNGRISIYDKKVIENIITKERKDGLKVLVTDLDGKVLYKTDNSNDTSINVYDAIKNYMDSSKKLNNRYNRKIESNTTEYVSFYPANFTDGRGYIIISGYPQPQITYERIKQNGPAYVSVIITFLVLFYFITNRKMKYIETVSNGLMEISKGNLDFRIKKMGEDELAYLSDSINYMASELKSKIEDERKAERTKSELITNVSHDLRTPLTSIKGYLGLIKEKKYKEESELIQYINIAYNKSEKLELLINDLFEYTKLSNNGINMKVENIALDELLEQLCEEMVPISEENSVSISKQFSGKKIIVSVDPNKTVRVFENLLTNAIRYSLKPGNINIILSKQAEFALVSVQNKCDDINEEDLNKIFDRFYRLDKSRSSETGGSGLGLAIAKNIVELQGGSIHAEYDNGTVSFNVKLKLV